MVSNQTQQKVLTPEDIEVLFSVSPLVIWGHSGSGKTTLIDYMYQQDNFRDNFEFCVSYTTRKPRVGEIHGENYLFLSDDEFEELAQKRQFAETEEVYGNQYGTTIPQLKDIISRGKIPVLHLGVKRCKQIMNLLPHSNSVFITLDNKSTVRDRLVGRRSEDETTLKKRL